ncbi:hypothetical protein TNCV_2902551 [Trichonephila clavipes]|nr:hypothetical protein TNCV_2902551 [Trichonephila clavipes]
MSSLALNPPCSCSFAISTVLKSTLIRGLNIAVSQVHRWRGHQLVPSSKVSSWYSLTLLINLSFLTIPHHLIHLFDLFSAGHLWRESVSAHIVSSQARCRHRTVRKRKHNITVSLLTVGMAGEKGLQREKGEVENREQGGWIEYASPYWWIPITTGKFDVQFPLQRKTPELWGCETILRIFILPRTPKPNRHSKDFLHSAYSHAMAAVDFLYHGNPPTWTGDEPTTLGVLDQRETI